MSDSGKHRPDPSGLPQKPAARKLTRAERLENLISELRGAAFWQRALPDHRWDEHALAERARDLYARAERLVNASDLPLFPTKPTMTGLDFETFVRGALSAVGGGGVGMIAIDAAEIPGSTIDEKAANLFSQDERLTHKAIALILKCDIKHISSRRRCKKYHIARLGAMPPRVHKKDL